jgi:hypothetical protein
VSPISSIQNPEIKEEGDEDKKEEEAKVTPPPHTHAHTHATHTPSKISHKATAKKTI